MELEGPARSHQMIACIVIIGIYSYMLEHNCLLRSPFSDNALIIIHLSQPCSHKAEES